MYSFHFILSFIHTFIHVFIHSFIHSLTHSSDIFANSADSVILFFIHSFNYLFINLFIHQLILYWTHSFLHSFNNSFIHWLINCLILAFTWHFRFSSLSLVNSVDSTFILSFISWIDLTISFVSSPSSTSLPLDILAAYSLEMNKYAWIGWKNWMNELMNESLWRFPSVFFRPPRLIALPPGIQVVYSLTNWSLPSQRKHAILTITFIVQCYHTCHGGFVITITGHKLISGTIQQSSMIRLF